MKVQVKKVYGYEGAIRSLYMSKGHLTEELEAEIDQACRDALDRDGRFIKIDENDSDLEASIQKAAAFTVMMDKVLKIGKMHITLLKFINFDILTRDIHRAGQDDIDAHAERFDNRIVRLSSRLSTAEELSAKSDYYEGKIKTDAEILLDSGLIYSLPDRYEDMSGVTWVKTVNGYVREEYANDKDVLRGLYMLSFPSTFTAQISLAQFAHVYKCRNANTKANPEVKEWAESVADQLFEFYPGFTKELLLAIDN